MGDFVSRFHTCKIFPPLCIFSYRLYLKCGFTLNVQSAGIQFWTPRPSTAWLKYVVSILFAYVFIKCCFIYYVHVYVSISYFSCMSKAETPSPHSSKKGQRKCGGCHSFISDLDPHPECNKCLPRVCCKDSPCPHCTPSPRICGGNGSASSPQRSSLRPRRDPMGNQ